MGAPYPPTVRQQQLLRFIAGYIEARGYCPSFNEMAAAIGATSRSLVSSLLDGLEERGHVRRLHSRVRATEVLYKPSLPRTLDGAPLYAVQWQGL